MTKHNRRIIKRDTGQKKIRYAVVGLGYISQSAVLPAFAHAKKNSALTALISGTSSKLEKLSEKYGVPIENCCSYSAYEDLLGSGAVDAVYIALPNSMHCEYAVRAAKCGVHVLCEKPLALTSEECTQMIRAAKDNEVKLMTAYRLHFDPANLKAVDIAQSGRLGDLKFFQSEFSMSVKEGDIRLRRDLGGGTLYDIGIYCLNAARYLFRDEPTEVCAVSANSGDQRFREVDESTSATMLFPGGRLATFTCSFGSADTARYRLVGTAGELTLEQCYEIAQPMRMELNIGGKKARFKFPKCDQFAPELVHFSSCVLEDGSPRPSGEEGLADVRIIEGLYSSAQTGQAERLSPIPTIRTRPSIEQAMSRPPVRKPVLIGARSPSEEN